MRQKIQDIIASVLPAGAIFDVSVPERAEFGHYSTNAALREAKRKFAVSSEQFAGKTKTPMEVAADLAKLRRSDDKSEVGVPTGASGKAPFEVAKRLVKDIEKIAPKGFFAKVEAVQPGFINFWLADGAVKHELKRINEKGKRFGESTIGKNKTVIVEYSQPNIAKKMHVGHLRTTVIGAALANMYEALGYTVVRWNYLGDWGTQFGKLIAAYKMWGAPSLPLRRTNNKQQANTDFIQALLDLYVRFHDELKFKPELEDMGREEFKKLEDGDKENLKLWKWFKDESLKEFKRIYKILDVDFDVWIGESFFEPQMKPLIEELEERGIATVSADALIVNLERFNLPPALVRKSDGATLYLTRDIANIRYRLEHYKPTKILYVVGNEQTFHFEQLFRVAELLALSGVEGMDSLKNVTLTHVKYGLVLDEGGKKFATREGRVVFLEEVIQKAVKLALQVVEEKSKDLTKKEKLAVANAVALGALKYTNLRENRHSDIRFDWQKMLDFSGDSGPYLQYTFARMRSILRKVKGKGQKVKDTGVARYLETEGELAVVRKMIEFPDAVRIAAETYAPNHLTNYLYELATSANKFYETTPILSDENAKRRNARLLLVATVADVLKRGLELLGIETPEKI